jgi:hypothetical protein
MIRELLHLFGVMETGLPKVPLVEIIWTDSTS